jgi:prepilin-type N-terminal cleavage/methylation domain-containing protein
MPANPKLERNDMTHTTETRPPRAITRQQGFSLVELAISLSLIAVLLLWAFYIVSNIRTSTVQKKFTESAYQTMAAGSKYMANNRYTNSVNTELLVGMGAGQVDQMIAHPVSTNMKAIKSAIPGAWEDIGNLCCAAGTATANQSIVYRLNKVPKAYCSFVVAELARYPSVGGVWGRAWTANSNHPTFPQGAKVATGTADSSRYNTSVSFNAGALTALCANNYSEIYATVMPI